jgi:hypothetical protein
MKHSHKPNLPGVHDDRDDTMSWLALIRAISYGATIGWIRLLARYGTSPQTVAAYGREPATSQTQIRLLSRAAQ